MLKKRHHLLTSTIPFLCIGNILLFLFIISKSTAPGFISAQTVEAIPTGTVASFNLASCPTGWDEFTLGRGRMIVGTNPAPIGTISARVRLASGGAEIHTLTTAQLTPHGHNGTTTDPVGVSDTLVYAAGAATAGWGALASTTGTRWGIADQINAGGGQSHNNYAPMIALLLCKKN